MRRYHPLTLALIITPFLPSCSAQGVNGPQASQRDSAGVVIVENRDPWTGEGGGWTIGPEPSLSMGTIQGEEAYQFFGVAGVHRLPDGRIVVVNAGSREVRVFDSQGVHIRSFGRQGSGPEEFAMPVLAGTVGDTLLIVDPAQHRLTLLDPDQGFLGVVRVSDDVGGWLNPVGAFANGQMVFGGAFDMRHVGELKNGLNRAHTFYRGANLDGSLAVDFGDKAGTEFYIKDLEGAGREARPALIPFAKGPVATVSPQHLFFCSGDAFEIEAYNVSGRMVRSIRLDRDPVAVTSAHGERFIADQLEGADEPGEAAAMEAFLRGMPLPELFPPLGGMIADGEGFLWVQDYQPPGEPAPLWSVFDPTGVLAARVAMPDGFQPLKIGADYLLGEFRDDMEVESIQLYPLSRKRRG